MNTTDYAQLRRRAEQCRAEEMTRLLSLARAAIGRWRARIAARRAPAAALRTTPRSC